MSIKGYPSQKKLTTKLSGLTDEQSQTKNEFVTAQPSYSDRNALDTVPASLYRIHPTVKTATPSTENPKRVFTSTSHGAQPKDVIRFESSAANPGFEASVLSTPDADTIVLGAETPNNIGSDNFYILRYVTNRVDDTGAVIVTTTNAPIQYVYNGSDTEVSQDTGTPGNSRPLPVTQLNTSGVAVNPATSDLQQAEAVLIGAVNETAPASDTASSGLNGRLQRIAQRITSLIALFPASIGQKAKTGSLAVTLASDEDLLSRLPASLGQKADAASLAVTISSEGTAQLGSLTETAPATDTASSGLNGRLQRIAQRITSLIALFPTSLGQKTAANSFAVTLASDQTPIADLTSSGNITTQNLVPAGTATANSAVLSGTLNGQNCATIQVTGTYTGALSLQCTVDNTNWITIGGLVFTNINTGDQAATITTGQTGIFQADCAGYNQIRVTGLAAMTGTAVVSIRATSAAGLVGLDLPLPTGTNTIGALTSNQSVNVSQIAGTTTATGAGTSSAGTQRIGIASGATATAANVSGSASSTTLLAASTSRLGASFYNDSTSICRVKFGATASTSSFTVLMQAGAYYELPGPHIYNGIIDGIWESATGAMRVTSW